MIEDLLLASASIGFILADIKQAWKLFKNYRFDTEAFSKTHFKLKILSLMLIIVAYSLLGTYIALLLAISQLFINIYIFKRIGGWIK